MDGTNQISANLARYVKAKSDELGIPPPKLVLRSFKGWQSGGAACYHAVWHRLMISPTLIETTDTNALKALVCHELIHATQRRETLLTVTVWLLFHLMGIASLGVFLVAILSSSDSWLKIAFFACMAMVVMGIMLTQVNLHYDRTTEAKELEADRRGALLFGDQYIYAKSMGSLWAGVWPPTDKVTRTRFQAMGLC